MNKINSHMIQKALIKDVFNIKDEKAKVFSYKDNKILKRNPKDVFSREGLFNKTDEDALTLERAMNEKLEAFVIDIFRKISQSEDEFIITYEDSIIVRRYLLVTFLRLNNIATSFEGDIEEVTNADYEIRFTANKPIERFFLNETFIKIVDHSEVNVLMDMNFFMTLPLDASNTDFDFLATHVNTFPGFLVPISSNKSILLFDNNLSKALLTSFIHKREIKTRFNIMDSKILLMNSNEVILPNGEREPALKLMAADEDEFLEHKKKFYDKIVSRDKKEYKYAWKIEKMSSDDFRLFILDNLNKYTSFKGYPDDHEIIFNDIDKVLNIIEDILEVEKYVSSNNPSDVTYWTTDESKKYNHKIWEILTPSVKTFLVKLKLSIKEYLKNNNQ